VDAEEIRWLSDTRDRLGEMGAGFLSNVLDQFIEAVRTGYQKPSDSSYSRPGGASCL
jgi:hypothetical protein